MIQIPKKYLTHTGEYVIISGKFNIVKFDRFVLGEGLEKRNDNFADEVMSQLGK